MKRKLQLVLFLLSALFFVACQDDPIDFTPQQLVGKWVNGTEYYRYDSNHEGATWDIADDVLESEAQKFSWTLNGATLTHIHHMEMGGNIPKTYTITELTDNKLSYKDVYNQTFTFTRVR